MTKKVTFAAKPKQSAKAATPDEWVASGQTQSQSTTRFTIDIPVDLHARIKSQCALRKVKMKEEIQALLEKHFPIKEG
jgi:hypothetical protein